MQARNLKAGEHVEVDVRGVRFPATVRSKPPGLVGIEPLNPRRYSWRFVSARQILRKLSKQEVGA